MKLKHSTKILSLALLLFCLPVPANSVIAGQESIISGVRNSNDASNTIGPSSPCAFRIARLCAGCHELANVPTIHTEMTKLIVYQLGVFSKY